MKKIIFSLGFTALALGATAQVKIKDGTVTGSSTTPNSNAILELESNNKGLLYPRVSLTATNAALPSTTMVAGMVVYNTATVAGTNGVTPGFYYSNGTIWVRLIDAPATSSAWSLTGNAGTVSATNFIGTADNQDLVFKRNNVQAGWLNSSSNNTAFGVNSLPITTTASQNVAVGVNTLTSTTGGQNTAVGFRTLFNNTSGGLNTAIGNSTLFNNTEGLRNTAVGASALANNTTGNYNVAVGVSALQGAAQNDSLNTAIGYGAGNNLTSGAGNIAIGANVQFPNTTGNYQLNIGNAIYGIGLDSTVQRASKILINATVPGTVASTASASTAAQQLATFTVNGGDAYINGITIGRGGGQTPSNTAFGVQALYNNISGYSNTAIGQNVLNQNTSGYLNTAMGLNALRNNTTGYRNVAIGLGALAANTDGFNNIAVGLSALQQIAANDSNNVAIGNGAGFSQLAGSYNIILGAGQLPNPTGNYQLNIANNIFGTGTDSVYGAGNIGINVNNPNSTFQVNGSVSGKISLQLASYSLLATDYTIVFVGGATGLTATLPPGTGIAGRIYRIVNQSGGAVTVSSTTPIVLLNGATGIAATAAATFQAAGNGTWYQISQ